MKTQINRVLVAFCLLLVWPISFSQSYVNDKSLVLVTNSLLEIGPFSPRELKKLYLGVPVYKGSRRIVPIRNRSDRFLYEVFLQKIIHMSADNYESRFFRKDAQAPTVFDADQVFSQLNSNRHSVSFMWQETAQTEPGIRIIQTLWNGRQ